MLRVVQPATVFDFDGKVDHPTGTTVVDENGFMGLVLYTGPLPKKKGDFIGVVWDDPERGKNDGTMDGHRYVLYSALVHACAW